MFQLHCPHCNELRDEQEFTHAGEAFIARPPSPESIDDDAWSDYLFMRKNVRGWYWEQWLHASGCRKVIVVKRHTGTYQIAGSWTLAQAKSLFLAEEVQS